MAERNNPPHSLLASDNIQAEPGPPQDRLELLVLSGLDAGRHTQLVHGTAVTVGSEKGVGLRLEAEDILPRHAEFTLTDGGLRVRALSPNAVVQTGAIRIFDALLPFSTRIKLGSLTLGFQHRAPGNLIEILAREGFVFRSSRMLSIAESAARAAKTDASILITGETGTGKEVMARAIHQLSMRRNGPFMVLDCAALTPTMVEAELFGHERGSFTGAERRRAGAFERAHGGTLFLDEIGELPVVHQASLLGVLQRRRLRRIGSDAEVDVDVRVVCATNRRLEEEIQAGRFRADLFYRLGTVPLHLPPLRERAEDLEDLIAQFWLEFSGCKPEPLRPSQLMTLSSYPFPGNVRELRGLVERALIDGHWPALPGREVKPTAEPSATVSELPGQSQSFRDAKEEALQAFERRFFANLIKLTDGNASEAARKASIDRPHLLRMLRKYGLRE